MPLYTFGYERQSIEDFVERLVKAQVQTVLDVRQLPLSRKQGFSKNAFARTLREAGLAYEHLPALGCPRSIRDQYKADADWSAYAKSFRSYLKGQSKAVAEVAASARNSTTCLVCFEADFERCHRSIVARAAARAGAPAVVHLTIRGAIPDDRSGPRPRRVYQADD